MGQVGFTHIYLVDLVFRLWFIYSPFFSPFACVLWDFFPAEMPSDRHAIVVSLDMANTPMATMASSGRRSMWLVTAVVGAVENTTEPRC